VYEGVRIDYRGADVTAENFLSVLLGDAAAMAGKGTGRVVDSSPHDKVGRRRPFRRGAGGQSHRVPQQQLLRGQLQGLAVVSW